MKMFVVTDNLMMFIKCHKLLKNISYLKVDYFCTPSSNDMFIQYIDKGIISPTTIEENEDILIKKYDIGFSCHSKQIFPQKIVNEIKCINIHPGLNPYNKGYYPHIFSIINKLPTGATLHRMDEKIDNGPIIDQEQVLIESHDTSIDVYKKIIEKEINLIKRNINNILNNKEEYSFPILNGNYNSKDDFKKLCELNLREKTTMGEVIDRLRALTHPPHKNAYFLNKEDKIYYISIKLVKHSDNHDSEINFKKLCKLNLDENITMGEAINRLIYISQFRYKYAYFLDKDNDEVYVSIEISY